MRELSKIWDTVNVKFLSTVRPFYAPWKKCWNFERRKLYYNSLSKFGANKDTNTNTEQTTQNPIQRHTYTHKYQPTNTRRKYLNVKMRNVARFKSPVLDAIHSAEWWCFKRMEKSNRKLLFAKTQPHTQTHCKKSFNFVKKTRALMFLHS